MRDRDTDGRTAQDGRIDNRIVEREDPSPPGSQVKKSYLFAICHLSHHHFRVCFLGTSLNIHTLCSHGVL